VRADDDLVEHCLELLAPLGVASAQRMFGAHGLRIDGVFMALVAFERLYLKVDDQTRAQFAAARCEPFTYTGKGKPVTMSYWTVPAQAMDSPEQMRPWARLALEAALRAAAAKKPNRRRR
jgi:DNA transformation protein and related proteins